uniref:SH3 domain containing 21 n=1 Tax=Neolamprologus brichardi TaxID=32507 RepID=A0A3Q4H8M9_NEOBR
NSDNTNKVLVLIDFESNSDDELTVKEGDVVKNVTKANEGWWEGELNGRCGFFPDNFVMVIPPINSLQVSGQKHNLKHNPVGLEFNCTAMKPWASHSINSLTHKWGHAGKTHHKEMQKSSKFWQPES